MDLVFEILTSSMLFLCIIAMKDLSSYLKAFASLLCKNQYEYKGGAEQLP